ncbi:hypothetical protein QFZ77_006036 [Paenibacillus sp. V4I3]|uniref:aspartyl-phosphate phosphatase Spo0E family protein n=1 Tax=unclassified Paenibacillus TaxID=185978 RepID=UPI0027889CD9|nr:MULTISPECIES: aspartyl-phosphate phosphatase Spo0E family protein [unclassified Paenibacillus]MDQ0877377.1 hypothetical protein [Paenibacillus sp. V4I3]MDQ0886758.1 hypothetical protein [Paenibacillus sp. V4I9]
MMKILEYQIEQLRSYLVGRAMIADCMTDERLVQLSQLLDRYIVEYQKLGKKIGMGDHTALDEGCKSSR